MTDYGLIGQSVSGSNSLVGTPGGTGVQRPSFADYLSKSIKADTPTAPGMSLGVGNAAPSNNVPNGNTGTSLISAPTHPLFASAQSAPNASTLPSAAPNTQQAPSTGPTLFQGGNAPVKTNAPTVQDYIDQVVLKDAPDYVKQNTHIDTAKLANDPAYQAWAKAHATTALDTTQVPLPSINAVTSSPYSAVTTDPNTIDFSKYLQTQANPVLGAESNALNQVQNQLGAQNTQYGGLAAQVAGGAPGVGVASVGPAAQMSAAQIANTPLAQRTVLGAAQQANGSTVDASQSDQIRAIQLKQLQDLQAQAGGQASSDAQRVMQQTTAQNLAAQVALANSAGGNPALNARNAANNLATVGQTAQGTALNLYAQEQQAAQGLLASQANATRGADVSVASQNSAQDMQKQLSNQAAQNNFSLSQASMDSATELQNTSQQYQAALQQAQLDQQAGLTNTQAINTANQLQAQLQQQASNLQAQIQADANSQAAQISLAGINAMTQGILGQQNIIGSNYNTLLNQSGTVALANQQATNQGNQFNANAQNAANQFNASNQFQTQAQNQNTSTGLYQAILGGQVSQGNSQGNNATALQIAQLQAQIQQQQLQQQQNNQWLQGVTGIGQIVAASDRTLKTAIVQSPRVANAILEYLSTLDAPSKEQKATLELAQSHAGPLVSDKGHDANDFFNSLTPSSYNYKKDAQIPEAGKPAYGVMAQDVEKHPVGKTLVVDTPQGKMLDIPRSLTLLLASHSTLAKKATEHDDKLNELFAALSKRKRSA